MWLTFSECSIWDWEEGTILADFNDTRTKASSNWTLPPVSFPNSANQKNYISYCF